MACMCGDLYCFSCGPAQGNMKCFICGKWEADGGCDDVAECQRIADEEAQRELEMQYHAEEFPQDDEYPRIPYHEEMC